MYSIINQRITEVLNFFAKGNQSIFAKKTGISATTINSYTIEEGKDKKRINSPKYENLESILQAYPSLSAEWLMRGEGEMLKETIKSNDNSSNLIQGDTTKKNNLAIADRRSKAIAGDSGVGSFENDPLKEKILQMQEVIDELRSDKKQLQSQIEYLQREKK